MQIYQDNGFIVCRARRGQGIMPYPLAARFGLRIQWSNPWGFESLLSHQ